MSARQVIVFQARAIGDVAAIRGQSRVLRYLHQSLDAFGLYRSCQPIALRTGCATDSNDVSAHVLQYGDLWQFDGSSEGNVQLSHVAFFDKLFAGAFVHEVKNAPSIFYERIDHHDVAARMACYFRQHEGIESCRPAEVCITREYDFDVGVEFFHRSRYVLHQENRLIARFGPF
jgi:hypothetical protein